MSEYRWVTSPFNAAYFEKPVIGVLSPHKPIIHDATLRSGEYVLNRPFTVEEKVLIAAKLDGIGIHMIESGSPAVSDEEKEAAKALLSQKFKAEISCSVRLVREDLSAAISCGLKNVVMATSLHPSGMKSMKFSKEDLLKKMRENVEYGRDNGVKVIVGATNLGWTHMDFIKEFAEVAIDAGAERIRISDPIGSLNMFGMIYLLRELKKVIEPSQLAVRCHNCLGLATANTLAAYVEGVGELSASVLGLGDRSGSAPLEEVLLSLLIFFDCDLGFRYDKLYDLARFIQELIGLTVSPMKPIVGENCFNLVAGAQVNLAKDDVFSISPFVPELVGQRLKVSLGAFSGGASVRTKLKELGLSVAEDKISFIVREVKELAVRKRGGVTDNDFKEIVSRAEAIRN